MLNVAPTAVYSLPTARITLCALMPTRMPRTLAALTADDALVLLRFDGKQLSMEEIDRKYLDQVAGGQIRFVPPWAETSCLYVQSRRLVEYDFTSRRPRLIRLTGALEEMPIRAEWCLTPERTMFVEIQDTTHYACGERVDVHLRAYHVRGVYAHVYARKTWMNRESLSWATAANRVLVCDAESGLQILDENLEPLSSHPLLECLAQQRFRHSSIVGASLHPTLPIAVLWIRECDELGMRCVSVARISWTNPKMLTIECVGRHDASGQWHEASYSASGKWLAYGVERSGRMHFFAIRIDGASSELRSLGAVSSPSMPLWLDKPDALVVFDGESDWVAEWEFSED